MTDYTTITGHLRYVSTGEYYFDHENGEVLNVFFITPEQARSVPINKLLALSGELKEYYGDDDYGINSFEVTIREPCYTSVNQVLGDPVQIKNIAIIRCIPLNASSDTADQRLAEAEAAAEYVEHYYKYFSKWDVVVRGFVMRYEGNTIPPMYARVAVAELEDAGAFGDFQPNYYHVWGGVANYCGQGTLGGNRSVTYTNNATADCGVRTIIHELGHNFWLHHAGLRKIDGSESEYGDRSSIMGSGQRLIEGHHSWHMVQLGWFQDREMKVVDSSQEILISPIEMPHHYIHPDQYQHVAIRKVGYYDVYLSLRKVRGTRYPQSVNAEGVLYVHQLDGDKKTKRIAPDMKIGDNMLQNGVMIYYDQYNPMTETAKVRVLFDQDDSVASLPMPEGFPTPIPSANVDKSNSGGWFFRDFNGQGIDCKINDDGEVVLYWYTYSQDGKGQQRWYTAHGYRHGNHALLDIHTVGGGTFDDPSGGTVMVVGEGQLYFLEDRCIFNYNTSEHDGGGMELEPLLLTEGNQQNGSWFDATKKGSGFAFQFYIRDGQDMCCGYWYNFDDAGNQIWFTCQGYFDGQDRYVLTLRQFVGGRFMYFDKPEMLEAGTAYLTVIDMDKMKLEYHIDYGLMQKEGILNLSRLF